MDRFIEGSDKEFKNSFNPTVGIDFKVKNVIIESKRIKLQIWDTGTVSGSNSPGYHLWFSRPRKVQFYYNCLLPKCEGCHNHVRRYTTVNIQVNWQMVWSYARTWPRWCRSRYCKWYRVYRCIISFFIRRLEINAICEATKKSTQSPEKINPLNLVVIFMNRVRKVWNLSQKKFFLYFIR